MLGAAVGVDVADDVFGVVAEQPFLAAVRIDDAVGVAGDVVVIAGLLAHRVGDVGQADVLVPFQPGIVAAVVAPLADCLGIASAIDSGVVGEIHAAAGAVGVAGDQVAVVLVVPGSAVFILGANQVAVPVVVIGGELAHQFAVLDFP